MSPVSPPFAGQVLAWVQSVGEPNPDLALDSIAPFDSGVSVTSGGPAEIWFTNLSGSYRDYRVFVDGAEVSWSDAWHIGGVAAGSALSVSVRVEEISSGAFWYFSVSVSAESPFTTDITFPVAAGSMSGTIALGAGTSLESLRLEDSEGVLWLFSGGVITDVVEGASMNRYSVVGNVISVSVASVPGPTFVRLSVV